MTGVATSNEYKRYELHVSSLFAERPRRKRFKGGLMRGCFRQTEIAQLSNRLYSITDACSAETRRNGFDSSESLCREIYKYYSSITISWRIIQKILKWKSAEIRVCQRIQVRFEKGLGHGSTPSSSLGVVNRWNGKYRFSLCRQAAGSLPEPERPRA